MTWLQRYRVRHYAQNSVWILPTLAIGAALVAVRVLHAVEVWLGLEIDLEPETVRGVLGTLAGAVFTFTVFVGSSLLLVVQLASAQLTPRVIGTMFRDSVTKWSLAIFVFTFAFVLSTLLRIDENVPMLLTRLAAYGCVVSICVFLYLIDHIGKMLRPSGVFKSVASEAHRVIERVYPRKLADSHDSIFAATDIIDRKRGRTVTSPVGGVVLAFDEKGLVALAVRHDCVIELVPQVGDFLAPGNPLFYIHGSADVSEDVLRHSIALGSERTLEQDPAFALRVIVDIASKSLSPAINDPTTAVLALDRLHHLLRHVGRRRLDNERVRDAGGRVRLMYRTPDWEDFVTLAVTEIRQFGGASIQVVKRLHTMLENLIETLPAIRAAPLRHELNVLKKSVQRLFPEAEDQALADIGDVQGIGGAAMPSRQSLAETSRTTAPSRVGD